MRVLIFKNFNSVASYPIPTRQSSKDFKWAGRKREKRGLMPERASESISVPR